MKLATITTVAVLLVSSMVSSEIIGETDETDETEGGYDAYIGSLRKVPADLNMHQLKVFLFDGYFETYVYFRELDKQQQRDVYDYYRELEGADISDIDARIRELM